MPKKWKSCVRKVKASNVKRKRRGKSTANPYKVCAKLRGKHRS